MLQFDIDNRWPHAPMQKAPVAPPGFSLRAGFFIDHMGACLSWRPLSFQTSTALAFAGNGSLISVLLDDCSLFMEVYMAKRKLRAWTKKDIAELKAHSKSRTPVAKISKVMKRTVDALRRKAGIVGIRLGHRRDGRSRQK